MPPSCREVFDVSVSNVANVAEDIEDSNLLPGPGFFGRCGMDQKSQEANHTHQRTVAKTCDIL